MLHTVMYLKVCVLCLTSAVCVTYSWPHGGTATVLKQTALYHAVAVWVGCGACAYAEISHPLQYRVPAPSSLAASCAFAAVFSIMMLYHASVVSCAPPCCRYH